MANFVKVCKTSDVKAGCGKSIDITANSLPSLISMAIFMRSTIPAATGAGLWPKASWTARP